MIGHGHITNYCVLSNGIWKLTSYIFHPIYYAHIRFYWFLWGPDWGNEHPWIDLQLHLNVCGMAQHILRFMRTIYTVLRLTHWGRDKITANSQTTFSNFIERKCMSFAIIWTNDGQFTAWRICCQWVDVWFCLILSTFTIHSRLIRLNNYRKVSNIRRTKSKTWMVLVPSCSSIYLIHWSQVSSWEWRYSWSSADRRCSNYIWVINNLIVY